MVATVLMFLVATVHLSIGLYRIVQAFIYHRESSDHPKGPNGYLDLPKDRYNIAQGKINCIRSGALAKTMFSHSFRRSEPDRRCS